MSHLDIGINLEITAIYFNFIYLFNPVECRMFIRTHEMFERSGGSANTARYCIAYKTMRCIYKTIKAGVLLVKLITNNIHVTLGRELNQLRMNIDCRYGIHV